MAKIHPYARVPPGLRIKTSAAMRAVDRWKDRISKRYTRFVGGLFFLLIAVGFGRQLILPVLMTVGLSLHFVLFELASLVVFVFLVIRLHSYRFANRFMR